LFVLVHRVNGDAYCFRDLPVGEASREMNQSLAFSSKQPDRIAR
jgi:hypothetical protein